MRIREAGQSSGEPMVLLHGLGSSARCWDRNLAALGGRHRLLLVDLFADTRGQRGVRRLRHGFSLEGAAAELAAGLDGRAIGPATVIGHSMGGLVALHLAAGAPELVSRLILVDVPAVPVRRRRLSQAGAILRSSLHADLAGAGVVASAFLGTSPLIMLAATRATLRADLGDDAQATGVPTLLIWGGDDAIVPVEVGRRLAQAMPLASLTIIQGIGHQPMWEAPEAFHAAVAAFLHRSPALPSIVWPSP